jgi:hypothetical protein
MVDDINMPLKGLPDNRELLKILDNIKNKKIIHFRPSLKPGVGFHYEGIGFSTFEEQGKFLDKLENIGAATRKPSASILQCNSCKSYNFYSKLVCSLCKSASLASGAVIEHDSCHNIDFDYKYIKADGSLRCDKCNKILNTIGVDYSRIGIFFKCLMCNAMLSSPEQQYLCLSCTKISSKDDLQISYLYEYAINDHRLSQLLDDLGYIIPAVEELDKRGIKSSLATSATGRSGIQHNFDLIVYDKHNNPFVVLETMGLLNETHSCKTEFILSFIGKCSDVKTLYKILVTFVDLEDNLQTLLNLNNIIIVRHSVSNKASLEIIQIISELTSNTIDKTTV